jgi:uncharacterized membrane protein YphA (DoxX/SURF4 family)
MNSVLWVVQAVLAAAFVTAGVMKLAQSRDALRARMGWVEDRTEPEVRLIGGLECLGAAGMILPGVLAWPAVLTTLAAIGLALTMVGAILVHVRRQEASQAALPAALLVLAAFVLWGRAGPYPL